MHTIKIKNIEIGENKPFVLISGPCVIESEESCFFIAEKLLEITTKLNIPFIFKASFDKANRSSINSYRGPGLQEGLKILKKLKDAYSIPITTDIHETSQIKEVSKIIDIIQIPAFLCRQTDLLVKSAKTGLPINIKKGQFLAPWDVKNIIVKINSVNNSNIIITERGTTFGYNNLVVDMKSIPIMKSFGYPICFDATHSLQLPGAAGTSSGGMREYVPHLVRAAVAVGIEALFLETHPDPDLALSDGLNMANLNEVETILKQAKEIDSIVKSIRV